MGRWSAREPIPPLAQVSIPTAPARTLAEVSATRSTGVSPVISRPWRENQSQPRRLCEEKTSEKTSPRNFRASERRRASIWVDR
jgi:hypothetical protein